MGWRENLSREPRARGASRPLTRPPRPSRPAYAERRPLQERPPSPSDARPAAPGVFAGGDAAGLAASELPTPPPLGRAPHRPPGPGWLRPRRRARPRRTLSPARPTHAEARPRDRLAQPRSAPPPDLTRPFRANRPPYPSAPLASQARPLRASRASVTSATYLVPRCGGGGPSPRGRSFGGGEVASPEFPR